MGIRMLNKFLQDKCKTSISCIHLSELSGKKIAVDISIYLYKFLSDDALLENLYLMISVFREHKIIPIFVFDGKPPVEKTDTIVSRKNIKKTAREEYYRLKQILDAIESEAVSDCDSVGVINKDGASSDTIVEFDEDTIVRIPSKSVDIRAMMDKLKKKFVILKQDHIQNAKMLLQAYGMTYIESPGEADILCAKLVSKNMVYACLSEDTDMFVYGCNRVLRYLSLSSWTTILYDFKGIIDTLDMTAYEFRQLCIMFGCDYLPKTEEKQNYKNTTIFASYKMFKNYKEHLNKLITNNDCDSQQLLSTKEENMDFYKWVLLSDENSEITYYVNEASKIIDLFDISSYDGLELYDNIKIMNGPVDRKRLIEVMEKENFIYIDQV
jgi:5'-3' exonuclease